MSTYFLGSSNPIFSHPKHPKLPNPMAACIHSSGTDNAQTNPLSFDPNRSQIDDHVYNYAKFCISNFTKSISYKTIGTVDHHDDLWLRMRDEAQSDVEQEPILSSFYYSSILSHNSLESALANHLSMKLSNSILPSGTLYDLFMGVFTEDQKIMRAVRDDLRAMRERDPACISYVHSFLNFKGFMACQSHRVAHKLWTQKRRTLALLIQNRVSEVFAVDIHPGARIGRGILFDHATGVVVGETAVIGDNVSILHNVTLGGTGKTSGDRHPKIGDGVLIGAGVSVLGNVRIGDWAKIGAGSLVLKEVPSRTTAVGNPARLIGGKVNPIRLNSIPGLTMDHTSWSDYVI